jgi:hypothetical protein
MTAIVTGKRVRPHQPLGPIPQGSESLEVWSDLYKPTWTRLGTIVREGGRHGRIVCTPESLECLLRRPQLLGYDAMDWLSGWSNAAVACWPKGEAPGQKPPLTAATTRPRQRCSLWRREPV